MEYTNITSTPRVTPYTVNWTFNKKSYTTTVKLLSTEGQTEDDIKHQISLDEGIHTNEITVTGFTRKMILHG